MKSASVFSLPALFSLLFLIQSCSSYQGNLLMNDELYLTKNETEQLDRATSYAYKAQESASSQNQSSSEDYDYYDDSYVPRTNRIAGPGSSFSPFNDPFANTNPRFNAQVGFGMGGVTPFGYSSLCMNCYDPFMNPTGWMPMSAYYGYGATAFYDPFYDPFWNNGFYGNMHPFYNPYRFAPPAVVVWPSNSGTKIIRAGSNTARSGSTRITQPNRHYSTTHSSSNTNDDTPVVGNNRSNSRNYSPNREYQNRSGNSTSGTASPNRNNSSRSYSPARGSGSSGSSNRSSGGSYRR